MDSTRPEKEIHISYASSRYKWGSLIFCEPSRFIEDIKEEYLEYTFQKGNIQHQNSTTDVDDDWLASKNYVSKNNYTSKKSTLPSKKEVLPKVIQTVPKNL